MAPQSYTEISQIDNAILSQLVKVRAQSQDPDLCDYYEVLNSVTGVNISYRGLNYDYSNLLWDKVDLLVDDLRRTDISRDSLCDLNVIVIPPSAVSDVHDLISMKNLGMLIEYL
jgi:hypothetical protein